MGSATDLPLAEASVRVALLLHVGMNIEDKGALFLRSPASGVLAHFRRLRPHDGPRSRRARVPSALGHRRLDVVRLGSGDLPLGGGGGRFEVVAERDRWEYGHEFMRNMVQRAAAEGPPAVGPYLFMGETAQEKLSNVVKALAARQVAPTEMIFVRPETPEVGLCSRMFVEHAVAPRAPLAGVRRTIE